MTGFADSKKRPLAFLKKPSKLRKQFRGKNDGWSFEVTKVRKRLISCLLALRSAN